MMKYFLTFGVLILSLLKPSHQISSIESPYYVGAVVEYHPMTDGNDGQTIAETNSNNYLTIIEAASQYDVDVIVFPESGLTTVPKDGNKPKKFNAAELRAYYDDVASYVPSPNDKIIMCDTDAKYKKSLRNLSCAAREHEMYVVVNHHERADCPEPDCAPGDFLLYNTNVVFDRNGKVVARYRKYNLHQEDGTNVTAQPEYSTFTTDFGVTFGQFICDDMLHEQPATFFVKNPNVTDVVYSTHWLDELPFLDAVQQQAAWSHATNVHLLASAFSDQDTASGGSGIYGGKHGPIMIHKPRETSNALVIAEIPKWTRAKLTDDKRKMLSAFIHEFTDTEVPTISSRRFELYPFSYHEDLRPYTTQILDPTQKLHVTTLCNRGLCCNFHVEIDYDSELAALSNTTQFTYRLAVFNGVRNLMNQTAAGVEVCALVACASDRIEDCGSLFNLSTWLAKPTKFNKLMITRRANIEERVLYEPSTLTVGYRLPFEKGDFIYFAKGHKNSSILVMYLVKPRSDIMTFGLYGRRFDRDNEEVTESESFEFRIPRTALIAAFLAITMVFWFRN